MASAALTDQEWFNNINQEGQDEIISWESLGDLTQVDVNGLKNFWFRDFPLKRARLQIVWANHPNPKRQQGKNRTMTTIHIIIKQNYASSLLMSYSDSSLSFDHLSYLFLSLRMFVNSFPHFIFSKYCFY
jgi:hypothetical protein